MRSVSRLAFHAALSLAAGKVRVFVDFPLSTDRVLRHLHPPLRTRRLFGFHPRAASLRLASLSAILLHSSCRTV